MCACVSARCRMCVFGAVGVCQGTHKCDGGSGHVWESGEVCAVCEPPWPELPASPTGLGQGLMGASDPRLALGTSQGEGLPAPPSPPLHVCPHLTKRQVRCSECGLGLCLAVCIPRRGKALNVPRSVPWDGDRHCHAVLCSVCGQAAPTGRAALQRQGGQPESHTLLPIGFCLCKGAPALCQITQSQRG